MPGFGVFLRKNLNEQLIFSPFLRNDDGFLVSVVEQEYGLNKEEATEMVYSFIEHIKTVLVEKKRFIIDGVGTLFVDDNGAIAMVMDTSKQISTNAATQQQPSATETQNIAQEVVAEPVVETVVAVQDEVAVEPEVAQQVTPVVEQAVEQPVAEPVVNAATPQIPRPVQTPKPQPIQQSRVVGGSHSINPVMMGGNRMNQGSSSISTKPNPQPIQTQPQQQYAQQRQTVPTPKQPAMGSGQASYSRPMQGGGFTKPRVQPSSQMGGGSRPQQFDTPRSSYTQGQQMQKPQQPQQGQQMQKPQQPQQQYPPQRKGAPAPQNRRAVPKKRGKQSKTDIWLTVAIVAALVVIGLMVFGILTAQESDMLL